MTNNQTELDINLSKIKKLINNDKIYEKVESIILNEIRINNNLLCDRCKSNHSNNNTFINDFFDEDHIDYE